MCAKIELNEEELEDLAFDLDPNKKKKRNRKKQPVKSIQLSSSNRKTGQVDPGISSTVKTKGQTQMIGLDGISVDVNSSILADDSIVESAVQHTQQEITMENNEGATPENRIENQTSNVQVRLIVVLDSYNLKVLQRVMLRNNFIVPMLSTSTLSILSSID